MGSCTCPCDDCKVYCGACTDGCGRHKRMTSWNEIPYNQNSTPEQKAEEFDRQYSENQSNGNQKEEAGTYRPEPNGRAN